MIPYDDLVAALTSWRARQGLPTAQPPNAPAPAPKAAAPAAAPAAAKPAAGAGQQRRATSPVAIAHDDSLDVDDSALLVDSSYESESDYAGYGDNERVTGENTAIGTPPAPPRRGGR
jgi:hypothetical protein